MSEVVTIGEATIYCGDCLDILPRIAPVNCVVTSPPYNTLSSIKNPTGMWAQSQWVAGVRDNGYSDDMPEDKYIEWQNLVFATIPRAADASLFYNHQMRWRDGGVSHPIKWFAPDGWGLRQEIIWARGGGMMHNARMFCRFDERILWFVAGQWKWNQEHVGLGTVWNIAPAQNKPHPVAFPLTIPTRCIAATTDPGDVVLDPFMGSGTTGVACADLGRKFIGIEIERKYFDIACERIEAAYAQGRLFA